MTFCQKTKHIQICSNNILLSRGCRQGDPISPFVFVLCAEILSHVIREKIDIKGIVLYDKEVKLSQYADDTTIYLGGDRESLCGVMRVLEWFRKISGLAINRNKTRVITIGALGGRSISWEGKFGLKWTSEFEVLGIKYKIDSMESITDDNIQIQFSVWNSRALTPYGKVVIIRSLLMSKITHWSRPFLPHQMPHCPSWTICFSDFYGVTNHLNFVKRNCRGKHHRWRSQTS